jgi:oligopeptide/dipeptide ABC transporter ATP-binding protein
MSAGGLLEVERIDVQLRSRRRASRRTGAAQILSGVSFAVAPGEIVGVIGETGSGKTTLARTVLGLIRPTAGTISFEGQEISSIGGRQLRALRRGGAIQLVFQDPLRSLDPDLDVTAIVAEGLDIRGGLSQAERAAQVARALELVGLDAAVAGRRPGELSGGQRQRVTIARAVVMEPKLLICDEPVSALDASNRNRILALLRELRDGLGIAIVIISHDLASIAGVVDRVAVLYRGRIVEEGDAAEVFRSPAHPYTALLLASAPRVSRSRWRFDLDPRQLQRESSDESDGGPDGGCVFAPRCRFAIARCRAEQPEPVAYGVGRSVGCHRASEWRAVLEGEAAR